MIMTSTFVPVFSYNHIDLYFIYRFLKTTTHTFIFYQFSCNNICFSFFLFSWNNDIYLYFIYRFLKITTSIFYLFFLPIFISFNQQINPSTSPFMVSQHFYIMKHTIKHILVLITYQHKRQKRLYWKSTNYVIIFNII